LRSEDSEELLAFFTPRAKENPEKLANEIKKLTIFTHLSKLESLDQGLRRT